MQTIIAWSSGIPICLNKNDECKGNASIGRHIHKHEKTKFNISAQLLCLEDICIPCKTDSFGADC